MVDDPVTAAVVAAVAAATLQLAGAAAYWTRMRGRARLVHAAANLPLGTRVSEVCPDGTEWTAGPSSGGEAGL
ncbi:hypothetical protein ABZ738_04615 [Micromonospora sp. NPDC047793]|uniref:hypothetical protein n=1 Tax=Micromonospora sp. NPDC047793 TaxID=3154342 RepID=UPI0033C1FB9B